jgi:Protein of unknown function (DUF3616)
VLDSAVGPTRGGRQRRFRLADLVQLPGPPDGEADIQGMARSGGWLWAVGSHSLVRRRVKPHHDDDKAVRRLAKVRRDPNRFVIVRMAVQIGVDRRPEPVRVSRDGRRSALVGAPGAENLTDLLRDDPHLAPSLAIPAKDNGFDVEGLAVHGDALYVGLRGPVLRGWAVVLELRPVPDPTNPGRLALGVVSDDARYRKHFLDLDGLGVRDLTVHDGAVGTGAGVPLARCGGARRRAGRAGAGADAGGRAPPRRGGRPRGGHRAAGRGRGDRRRRGQRGGRWRAPARGVRQPRAGAAAASRRGGGGRRAHPGVATVRRAGRRVRLTACDI